MVMLDKGRYKARVSSQADDIAAAQALRHLCFRGVPGCDSDAFDPLCRHVLIEDTQSGRLVCCYRLMVLNSGDEITRSYSARHYNLDALRQFKGRMIEMGRFCMHPDHHDPDILRVAWGAMTRIVDAEGVGMVFGCSSFKGTEADAYIDAFAQLRRGHLAPRQWFPQIKAPRVFRFGARLATRKADPKRAALTLPPLLRSYLLMGGWVSDHAVIDADLDTLHVFTGLEIAAIPPARARALRAVAS